MILEITPKGLTPAGHSAGISRDSLLAVHGLVCRADAEMRRQHKMSKKLRVYDRGDALAATADDSAGAHWGRVQHFLLKQHSDALYHQRPDLAPKDWAARGDAALPELNVTQAMYRTFEQKRAPRHYRELARVTNSLGMGVQFYQLAYREDTGEAAVYAGGDGDIQNVIADASFANLQQIHLITRAEAGMIEAAQWAYGGLGDLQAVLRSASIEAHEGAVNRLAFEGLATPLQLGLFNYPGITEHATGLALSSMTAAQLFTALVDQVRRPVENSSQAFSPNKLALAPEIMSKAMSLTMTGSDITVAQKFREAMPGVELVEWRELTGEPASTEYAMYAADTRNGPELEMSPVIFVPVQMSGMMTAIYAYRSYAGLIHPYVASAEIGIFSA